MLVTFFAAGTEPPEWQAVVLSGGQVVAHAFIGLTLRNASVLTENKTSSNDPTTR